MLLQLQPQDHRLPAQSKADSYHAQTAEDSNLGFQRGGPSYSVRGFIRNDL